jgi:hypothetical protein
MKKGQIAGQIFIYILAALIIGMIVLLGYWAINKIVPQTCEVEQLSFKKNIENMLEQYNSFGSVKKVTIASPCEYEQLCFIAAGTIGDPTSLPHCDNKIIASSAHDGDQKNIFAIAQKRVIPIGYSSFVSVDDETACTCISQRNKNFYITLKGNGASTTVTPTTS